jgi:hypothetical protein
MLRNMDTVKVQSVYAKYYDNKIKTNPEFYNNEKKRVIEYIKNRYATDEEYRNRVKEQKLQSYYRRKARIALNNQVVVN